MFSRKTKKQVGQKVVVVLDEVPKKSIKSCAASIASTISTANSICTTGSVSSTVVEDPWNDKDFEGMAALYKLSPSDKQKIRQLQNCILDVESWKNDPYEVIRFYRHAKGNVKKAEQSFRNVVKWRVDNDMDNFLENYGTPDPLWHQMPHVILDTVDKEGFPIYFDRYGATDFASYVKNFGGEGLVNHILFLRELYGSREFWKPFEEKRGHRPSQVTVVMDMQGLNGNHIRPSVLGPFLKASKISQEMYPGGNTRIILLRAPKMFKTLWALAKHCVDPAIQDSLIVTSQSDYKQVLLKYIDEEALPDILAPGVGKAKPMPGYMSQCSLEGGPLRMDAPFIKKQTSFSSVVSGMSNTSELSSSDVSVSTSVVMKGSWKGSTVSAKSMI